MSNIKSMRRYLPGSAIVFLSLIWLAAPQASQDDDSGDFILFTTDRDNPSPRGICPNCEDIYVMAPDGTNPIRLTHGGGAPADAAAYNSTGPDWSRNREMIAFHSNRIDRIPQIFLMNADGTDERLLVSLGPAGAAFPSFSHNGNKVCFNSQVRPRDIYTINVQGGGLTNVTSPGDPGAAGDNLRCDWSPKGNGILFGSTRDTASGEVTNEELYVMNPDGSGVFRLTYAAGTDANASWSPTGDRIAFESNRDGNPEIYVMNADGSNQVRLTTFAGQDTKPTWSPAGDRIAFHRRIPDPPPAIGGHLQVFTMIAEPGAEPTQITFTPLPGFSGFPAWGAWAPRP